ncbi:DUF4428 domain-containing protein [Oscillibacter sp. GMB15532]|uniref:DUF4428 domain-containing protein n=1 Tax=Oscillibacter sp. GMB15532 TaxID=3230022 RepID=UPI0034DE3A3C
MVLFSKRPPCPICGSKIPLIFPWKIEGEYVCNACHGKLDIDPERQINLSMHDFREYLMFYEQNQLLKDQFLIDQRIDFGLWDPKVIFDFKNKLFCISEVPDKTVFEADQLKSFVIKEDRVPLFEGSATGILRYPSTVPGRAMALAPQVAQFIINKQMACTPDRMDDGKENGSAHTQYFNMQEPFRAFHVELHFEHPYWSVLRCDMDGPRFSNELPDVSDYLCDYQHSVEEIEKLVAALQAVSFPDAAERSAGPGAAQETQAVPASPANAIGEIRKDKGLMKDGTISQQNFDEKKRQLMGI